MSHPTVGVQAPDFSLTFKPGPDRVTLSELRGETVVVLFFPLAFSGTCTEELCRIAQDWSEWKALGVRVLGISADSVFVNQRFAAETGVPFLLLSDYNKETIEEWGVVYEDFFGQRRVPKRAAFVVDPQGVIRYAWVTEDADVLPPFEDIRNAAKG